MSRVAEEAAPTGANHEPLPPCRAAFRRLRELKIENGKCRMMEVAPCATPQFYTLHFTFYISHAAAPFWPSAVGKSHRHEPGTARHEHLCPPITSSAISQETERSLIKACELSPIMRIASERLSRIVAPRLPTLSESHSLQLFSSYPPTI